MLFDPSHFVSAHSLMTEQNAKSLLLCLPFICTFGAVFSHLLFNPSHFVPVPGAIMVLGQNRMDLLDPAFQWFIYKYLNTCKMLQLPVHIRTNLCIVMTIVWIREPFAGHPDHPTRALVRSQA